MSDRCPICRTPYPGGRLAGLCAVCFLDGADEPEELSGLVRGPEIARGGMGIVYRAEQAVPKRTVAMKILKPEWAGNETLRERFRREAHAMAGLDHPAVLPVYEVGESDGLPWFTMKLASGGSLAERIADFAGKWRDSARLIERLARALGFAHERGVLHCDIKPGNILFDADGRCYLADFGLAKRLDNTLEPFGHLSATGVIGTPRYLAPELASGHSQQTTATIASDTYSLGAVLHEMLVGEELHVSTDPSASPRKNSPPGDLLAICEKAMASQREQRYATARELAEDLSRYLRGFPVLARRGGFGESIWRWALRHPSTTVLLGFVSMLLIILFLGSAQALLRIRQAEKDATAAKVQAEAHLRQALLAEAEGVRRGRLPNFRARVLAQVAMASEANESTAMRMTRRCEATAALAFPELREAPLPPGPSESNGGGPWLMAAAAPGLEWIAWKSAKPSAHSSWKITRDTRGIVSQPGPGSQNTPVRICRNGRWLATLRAGGEDGWDLWDISQPEARLHAHYPGHPEDLSDDGSLVAYFHDQAPGVVMAEVRETQSGQLRFVHSYHISPRGPVRMRFSGDAALCAMASTVPLPEPHVAPSIRVCRTSDGAAEREIPLDRGSSIAVLAWSRVGRLLAASERGAATRVWDTDTGKTQHIISGFGADVRQMTFSHDSRSLAMIGNEQMITILDLISGQVMVRNFCWICESGAELSWSAADPEVLGPISLDARPLFLRVRPGVYKTSRIADFRSGSQAIAVLPDCGRVVSSDAQGLCEWDLTGAKPPRALSSDRWDALAASPDGKTLYAAGNGRVSSWQVDDQGVVASSMRALFTGLEKAVKSLDVSGGHLAIAGPDGFELWRLADRTKLAEQSTAAHWVALSPDGQFLIVVRDRYEVWSIPEARRRLTLPSRPVDFAQARACFRSDSRWLITGHAFGRISLWDTESWEQFNVLESPASQPLGYLALNRDKTRIYSAGTDGIVVTWDLARLSRELKVRGIAP